MVLGGNPPSDDLLTWRLEDADRSIAVDGGFLSFMHTDHLPDVLIGDLDSVTELDTLEFKYPELLVVRIDDQGTTDFQKALVWVKENSQTSHLIVLGALGKRTDHLITNLMIALTADESLEITFDDDQEWIRRVTPVCPLLLHGRKGDGLSLLFIKECSGVETTGLKWNLKEDCLDHNQIIGQSNLCESDSVEIRCTAGSFFVFLEKG
jgi:thiamine pyrophosphokinase